MKRVVHCNYEVSFGFGPKYAKIDQDSIRNYVLMNGLARAAQEGRSNVYVTSDLRVNTDQNRKKETSIKVKENYYAVKKVGHKNHRTAKHYTVRWYSCGPRAARSNLPSISRTVSSRLIVVVYKSVNTNVNLQSKREDQLEKRLLL